MFYTVVSMDLPAVFRLMTQYYGLDRTLVLVPCFSLLCLSLCSRALIHDREAKLHGKNSPGIKNRKGMVKVSNILCGRP